MNADPGCMRYWVDRAGVAFPRHPTVFRLNQRLLQAEDADSSTIATLLKEQIAARPSHPPSHARFLQHLLQYKQIREAFDYAYETHTSNKGPFGDSYLWLDAIVQVVDAYKSDISNSTDSTVWNYWLLCLTVLERKTYLQLQKSTPADVMSALKIFDKALYDVSVCQKLKLKDHLLKHFGGQFCLYGGSAILMKALNSQMNWRDAIRFAAPLFILAFQMESPDTQQKDLSSRWTSIASYRMSQAGHTISICFKEKKRLFLDNISQYFSDKLWRNKLYKDLFGNGDISKMSSYIVNPKSFVEPVLKFPNLGIELQQSDLTSRTFSTGSLHLQTWIGLNIEKLSKISSIETDELPWDIDNLSNCGPETLCKFDIDAFLYCTILIAQKNIELSRKLNSGKVSGNQDRPNILPEVLMEPLCSAEQAKWWEYVEFSVRRDTGCQSSDIRSHLIRGVEAVRCLANHGIDPYILHAVAKIFSQRADIDSNKRVSLLKRAKLYYENALSSLEKLHDRISYNVSKNQIFNFTTQDSSRERTNHLIEEAKLFLGNYYMENDDNDKAIDILTSVKSPYASFNLFKIHMKLADDQKECSTVEMKSKRFSLLSKARKYVYITLDKVRDHIGESHPLSEIIDECIESVEKQLSSLNMDSNACKISENEYSSDQQSSVDENNQSESTPVKFREPIHVSSSSSSMKVQLHDLKRKEFLSESVLQQISALLESNKLLTEQVYEFKSSLNDIKSHQMDAVDRRKFFNSVDDIRCKVDELREENCINTMDLKREINDLRKELEKLKISPQSAQRQDDNELLLLEETYKNSSAALSYLSRVNNGNPAMPPANPYSLYPSNLYPLYAGQFPAVPHVFPPPTLFPPDQTLYSDLLVPPQVPPPQPAQSVIHDYHIPLPTQSQPVAPSILSSQTTSTPNKPILDTSHMNTGLSKNFNIFEAQKSNSLFDTSKSNSTLDTMKPALNLSAPFIFNKEKQDVSAINKSRTLSEKSNDSYDPLPDYQPMVPLPDEIVPTTGEEGEEIIFDSRAKLFRFIGGEWKERGLGQLKLLKNEVTGKIRLLMRRDIVHTVCANHIISPEMELSPMKGSDKAYFWVANDFADETVKLEKFSVRFKTVDIGKKFFETFNNSKNQAITVSNENKADKTPQTKDSSIANESIKSSVANSVGGFTFTTAPTLKVVEKDTPPVTNVTTTDTKPNPFAGFTFKKVSAFNVTSSPTSTTNTFQTSTVSQIDNKSTQDDPNTKTTLSGWGDKFKPKAGSWNCSACYITNDATNSYCVACDNPKEPGMPKKPEPKPTVDVSKFTFGFPPAAVSAAPVVPSVPISSVTTAPNTGLASNFKFGFNISTTTTTTATTFPFGHPQTVSPAKTDTQPFILGAMENTKYEFAFTPKPTVPKSPNRSLNESATDDNDNTQEDEGHHIFFEPVIPMPEKVKFSIGLTAFFFQSNFY